jgi:hypothetical protein
MSRFVTSEESREAVQVAFALGVLAGGFAVAIAGAVLASMGVPL